MKFQFPHFSHRIPSRVISSLEMTLLWGGLAALIAVNVFFIQKGRPAYWNKLMMLFETPLSPPRRIDLASLLWQLGNKQEARNVLGATTTSAGILAQWEKEEKKIEEQYAFWKSVAVKHPDYRDAFVTLTSLSYQLGKLEEAHSWLSRAQALDPNSPVIQKFSTILK